MPHAKLTILGTLLGNLAILALVLVFSKGQNGASASFSCSAQAFSAHSWCVRELDALKTLHDRWTAEDHASII